MIETERLTLRPLSRDDLDAWTEFMTDADARAGLHTPDASTPEQAEAALERFVEVAEMYALIVRDTGETAGFVGFVPRTMEWGEELELGWMLMPAHRGRGYGKAAMLLAEEEARRHGLDRVALNVFGANEVARRLYRSLGYEENAVAMSKTV